MARARTAALPLLLLAVSAWAFLILCSPSKTEAFVGLRGADSALSAATMEIRQRAPEAMQARTGARGGAGEIGMDEGTYVLGITLLFFASVAANAQGFFNAW